MINKYEILVQLANEAQDQRRSGNKETFNEIISKIIDMDDNQLFKADLINLIAYDKYDDTDTWINDFILYDLIHSSGVRSSELLEMLLKIGTGDAEEVYRRELVAALDRLIQTGEFYNLEDSIMASDLPEHLLPVIFNIVGRQRYKKPVRWEPSPFYIVDNSNRIAINSSDFLVRETLNSYRYYQKREIYENEDQVKAAGHYDEVYENYPNTEEHMGDDIHYWKNRGEEIVYQACYDENDNLIIEELKEIAYHNSKAGHTLLKLEGKSYEAWFDHSALHL